MGDFEGLPLPDLASEMNPRGVSRNELKVLQAAIELGWRIAGYDDTYRVWELRKHGRGYVRLQFARNGRPMRASTQRKYLTPRTDRIIEHLKGRNGAQRNCA